MTNNNHPPPTIRLSTAREATKRTVRLKAYAKFIDHVMSACAALYEMVTGERAPKWRDVVRGR
jgi:hypothetical protein